MTAGAQPEGVASPAPWSRTSAQEVRLPISSVSRDSTRALAASLHYSSREQGEQQGHPYATTARSSVSYKANVRRRTDSSACGARSCPG